MSTFMLSQCFENQTGLAGLTGQTATRHLVWFGSLVDPGTHSTHSHLGFNTGLIYFGLGQKASLSFSHGLKRPFVMH